MGYSFKESHFFTHYKSKALLQLGIKGLESLKNAKKTKLVDIKIEYYLRFHVKTSAYKNDRHVGSTVTI